MMPLSTKPLNIDIKYYQHALKHFDNVDLIMSNLLRDALNGVRRIRLIEKQDASRYFEDILSSIVSQQLSVKAAATIWNRFVDELGKDNIKPEFVKNIPVDDLRAIGLSRQKASYVISIAESFNEKLLDINSIDKMSNQEVISTLTKLKGVGLWTAEMFLIFSLARRDVFSAGDYGLIKAIRQNYGAEIDQLTAAKIAMRWSPYQTAASLALWHSLDNKK